MNERDQVMTKMRVRRLLEQVLDGDIVQADIQEEDEETGDGNTQKRLTMVIRYIPA